MAHMTSISTTERNLIRTDLVYYLFAVFLSGCLVGWIYEEIFYWITEGMLRKRGILYGPWLHIYGFGTLGIYAMKPMKKTSGFAAFPHLVASVKADSKNT